VEGLVDLSGMYCLIRKNVIAVTGWMSSTQPGHFVQYILGLYDARLPKLLTV